MNVRTAVRAGALVAAAALLAFAGVGAERASAVLETADLVVQLDGTPAGVARAEQGASFDEAATLAALRETQDRFLANLADAGIDATVLTTPYQEAGGDATTVELRYFWAANGLAIQVPAGSEETIAALPDVRHVEPVREVEAFLDTSVPYTGATSVWEDYGFRGEGIDVADIDTGIAWDHPEFTTDPTIPPGPLHPKVKKYHTFTAGLVDGYGHGTHVAGIIAGDSSLGHAVVDPLTGYGEAVLDGVAPKANLFGYKVLSDAGTGLSTSVALGIDQAVKDRAHVINLSLGSTDDSPNSISAVASANAMKAGVFTAIAAGNSGPTYSTIGTPATRQEPLTVGSSTDPGNVQYYVNDRADAQRFAINLLANSPAPPSDNPIEAHYVYVELGCSSTDYLAKEPVVGRIALIQRGVCTFTQKKELAQLHGAVAAIIFNNVEGNFAGTMTRSKIVVAALSDVDGQHLVGHVDATTGLSSHTLQFDPSSDSRLGQVSGFSSRGPTDDYRIKPEIVAPGDTVTSSVPVAAFPLGDPSGYADAGGTSMATPHVAGAAALVRQAHPDWTTAEMKAAMMNTAHELVDPADGKPYSIMDQGAGVLDVRAAIDTPAVILDPSHSFRVVRTGGGTVTVSHEFTIVDLSGAGGAWSLSWRDGDGKNRGGQGRALPAEGWSQTLSPSEVTVPAGGTATFTLSVTIDGALLADGDYEGHVVASGGGVTLRVPVFARHERGALTAAPDLTVASITTSNNNARQGEKVTITATIANGGDATADASQTEFLLDDATVLGLVDTPSIPAGGTATVSVDWDTRGVKGEHTIRVTADRNGHVAESNEDNNSATLTVTVRGNRVTNGSFEQASSSGDGPEGWSASDTGAGTTSWSDGGSDGAKSASFTGTGGSVVVSGAPTWTSDAIAVTAGETLDVVVSVQTADASSSASVGLAYLDAAGALLDTVSVLTAPLTSDGFETLEQSVTVPAGVAEVRVVLTGFAATDAETAGTVTFDDVGLFGQ